MFIAIKSDAKIVDGIEIIEILIEYFAANRFTINHKLRTFDSQETATLIY